MVGTFVLKIIVGHPRQRPDATSSGHEELDGGGGVLAQGQVGGGELVAELVSLLVGGRGGGAAPDFRFTPLPQTAQTLAPLLVLLPFFVSTSAAHQSTTYSRILLLTLLARSPHQVTEFQCL